MIVGAGTGLSIQAWYGFQIMIEDIRRCLVQYFQRDVHPAAEIRHQNFNPGCRTVLARGADTGREVARAAITQIIPVHRCDNHVVQCHRPDCQSEVLRLIRIKRIGSAVGHITEWAATRTDITHDHKCGRAVTKTFANIGTGRLFTHGI